MESSKFIVSVSCDEPSFRVKHVFLPSLESAIETAKIILSKEYVNRVVISIEGYDLYEFKK